MFGLNAKYINCTFLVFLLRSKCMFSANTALVALPCDYGILSYMKHGDYIYTIIKHLVHVKMKKVECFLPKIKVSKMKLGLAINI